MSQNSPPHLLILELSQAFIYIRKSSHVSLTIALKISFPSHEHCQQLCSATSDFTPEPLCFCVMCSPRPFSIQCLLPTGARITHQKILPYTKSTVVGYNDCFSPANPLPKFICWNPALQPPMWWYQEVDIWKTTVRVRPSWMALGLL